MSTVLILSVPSIISGKIDSVITTVFEKQMKSSEILIGIENEFIEASAEIKGFLLYMPDARGLSALFERLGVAGRAEDTDEKKRKV